MTPSGAIVDGLQGEKSESEGGEYVPRGRRQYSEETIVSIGNVVIRWEMKMGDNIGQMGMVRRTPLWAIDGENNRYRQMAWCE